MTRIKMEEILEKTQLPADKKAMVEDTIEKCGINKKAKEVLAVMANALFMMGVNAGVDIVNDMLEEKGI